MNAREKRLVEEYEAQVGRDARRRQEQLGRNRFSCCGTPVEDGHHPACSKHTPDPPPPLIEGQETLL